MNLGEYETLSGITVSSGNAKKVEAQIKRTQRILEEMLGFTLTKSLVNTNEYTETGKTQDTYLCYYEVNEENLDAPDAVVNAYRLFPYNKADRFLLIDPASAIHKVKLIKDSVTYRTLEADDFRKDYKRGVIKYLEQYKHCWCGCDLLYCDGLQLAVDADWLWDTTLPEDLMQVWADMVTYYSHNKKEIKSESLGTHSYTKFDRTKPEEESINMATIKRYAGPNGPLIRTITI